MSVKIFQIGLVGRWIGISYVYAHKKIGIGLWCFVIELDLLKKTNPT